MTHVRTGLTFRALADHQPGFKSRPAAEGQYVFGAEERSQDNLFLLRSDFAEAQIVVGDELTDPNERSFRVVAIEDSPNNLLVRLSAESSLA